MTLPVVLLLAAFQGLTEFLPVSSSGHLRVVERWFGIEGPQTAFDVTLHLATLLSVVVFFLVHERKTSLELLSLRHRRLWLAIVVATIPTGVLGVTLGKWSEEHLLDLAWVGAAFLVTAALLLSTKWREPRESKAEPGWREALWVGLAQGLGTLRGVSRSGITITTGLHAGLSREAAFSFSFLISVPAILGAFLLEFRRVEALDMPMSTLAAGFALAFVTGYIALVVLRRVVVGGHFWWFGVYAALAGVAVLGVRFFGVGA